MLYLAKDVETKKLEYISWLQNLAEDVNGIEDEDLDLFSGSEDCDTDTIKGLIGNFLAYLTGKDVSII